MSITANDLVQFLEEFAPPALAEDWDNVGLLLGDFAHTIHSVMTCLTLTPDVAKEAIDQKADFVITHHPILFRAVKRLTSETAEGEMLLKLIRAGVAVFSPHTSFDNAESGINQWLADRLDLKNVTPLRPDPSASELPDALGAGRYGDLDSPETWTEFKSRVSNKLKLACFQSVAPQNTTIERVGIACGAAGEFLGDAHRAGCGVFVTGETRFHGCLEARSLGIGLILLGHYASERPALEMLAERVAKRFPNLSVWASAVETDPITWEIVDPK